MKQFFIILLLAVSFCGYSQNNIAYMGGTEIAKTKSKTPETTSNTSHFNFSEGLILVNASIDGQSGEFILDTGAPGLVLNSTEKASNVVLASSVSASIEVGRIVVENFQWGNFEEMNIESYTLDISHMNKGSKGSPDGLIGYQILKKQSVLVDFENEEISILSKKDLKHKVKTSSNVATIPFELEGHLPIVVLKIDGKNYRFAIDTGAEKNLFDKKLFEKTAPTNVKYELMQGLDGGIRKVAIGQLENLTTKKYDIAKMEFLYSDLSNVNSGDNGYNIDGLLGLPFFQNKTFAIDYRKGEIHIWE